MRENYEKSETMECMILPPDSPEWVVFEVMLIAFVWDGLVDLY
jgi:hypothetical protein